MEHGFIRDAVPVGTVKDDGLRLHYTRLLVARELAKRFEGLHAATAGSMVG